MCDVCQSTYAPKDELCPVCAPVEVIVHKEYIEFLERKLRGFKAACTELLDYIRQTHPADFYEDGRGFTRSSHRAIDRALNGDECFPTSKLPYEEL